MSIDTFLIGFSFAAGAATFFSPCSVGLFPAYIGYYLSLEGGKAEGRSLSSNLDSSSMTIIRALKGVRLGLVASLGFLLLFLAVGGVVSLVGSRFLGPYLKWISIGIGIAIIILGWLQWAGRDLGISLPFRVPTSKTGLSVFAFGIGYALASLGCTLPVFLSALFASLAAGGAAGTLLVLLSYAGGMGLVMVVVTTSLAVSEEAAKAYVGRLVPIIRRLSSGLLILAGAVIIYFYTVVWT
ncbi:MAG: cytochrome c biogenesis CcdA family protein [Candidatus Geothermarchaeales archaeon]